MKTQSMVRMLALAGALGACSTDEPEPHTPSAATALRRLADCDDLRGRLGEVITEALVKSRYGYRGVVWEGEPGAPAEDGAGDDLGGGADAPTDYTGTNNQEEGVDELDLVKTDGTHLYVAEDRALHVVKSWPVDEPEVLATVELDGWVQGVFLAGDKAVVFSQQSGGYGYGGGVVVDDEAPPPTDDGDVDDPGQTEPGSPGSSEGSSGGGADGGTGEDTDVDVDTGKGEPGVPQGSDFSGTRMTVIDVSDPAAPVVERTIDLEGWLTDARLIDGKVTFVLNQYVEIPAEAWNLVWSDQVQHPPNPDWDASEAEWQAAEAQARAVLAPVVADLVADLDLADVIPGWRSDPDAELEPMYACDDLYAPGVITPLAMLGVGTLDPVTGEVGTTGVLTDGWTVYASQENLYVAQSSQWWWGWDDEARSAVHAFRLGGAEPAYVASGTVDGWVYDQFALSEYDGFLRVVTTDFTGWWLGEPGEEAPEDPANHVYVLEDDGEGSLDVVGHVGGIAPGERVMAARLLGDKGYVVTFRNTDPLFTLDLSDPTDPKVAGELVMPGYSAYLHPLDEDHLLAVGMAGNPDGALTGMAVNVFDVSDLSDPKLQHHHEIAADDGWSWSEALWDHHAFTFHRGVLTIPATLESWDEASGWSGFSGTISFDVDLDAGISELGRVDHADLVPDSECLYTRWYGWDGACAWDYGYWYAQVRRSVYVEDALLTVSDYGVKVNQLRNPGIELGRVVFYPR